jgi:predicted nuclease of predicted toxin-antitoxin system
MRILIDECIPRKFKMSLHGHECKTVPEVGLSGKKNGDVLASAESQGFDVFLTLDQGLEYEQNLAGRRIAILILRAKSNRLAHLLPHVPTCLARLESIKPGQLVKVGG